MLETSSNENPEIFSSVNRDDSVIFSSIYHQPVSTIRQNKQLGSRKMGVESSREERGGQQTDPDPGQTGVED